MKAQKVSPKVRAAVRGEVTITCQSRSGTVRRIAVRNTITYLGLNALLALLAQTVDPTTYAAAKLVPGTSGTPPTPGDLAMGSPVSAPGHITLGGANFSHSWAARELTITATLEEGQANGQTLREIGIALADGSIFARQVHPGFEKTEIMTVVYTWRIAITA